MNSSTPPPVHSEGSSPSWQVGTLKYTSWGLAGLFFWLLCGDFAWNMKERAVIPVAQLMLKELKASDMIVGLLVGSLPAALGFFLGPIVGVMSDNHRGKWGRRIPYLFIPTPIIAVSMIGLAFTPKMGVSLHEYLGSSSPGLVVVSISIFAFFWTLFEVATVIANTVFMALINDVVPAKIIGRFFSCFRAIGLIAAIIFYYYIIGKAETHTLEIFFWIGLIYSLGMALMCYKVKEGSYPPPQTKIITESFIDKVKTYFRECYSHPYYRTLFIAMAFAALAAGPVNSFSIFYAKSIGMSMETYGKYGAVTYAISLSLAYFLGLFADRFHPLRVGIGVMAVYALMLFWAGFFATTPHLFGIGFVAHGVLSGAYLTGAASLGNRLFHRDKFGQLFSAFGILNAFAYMTMPPLVGWILDISGHRYQLTFLMSGLLALVGLGFLIRVYRQFLKLGGDQNYQAPLP